MTSPTATANATIPDSPSISPASLRRTPARTFTLWTVQILLGALFVFAGVNKLLGLQQEVVSSFARIGLGAWFRYLVGALELAGGAGLLIPRLSGLAALELTGVMTGAILTHLFVLPPVYLAAIPAVLATVFASIARARRAEIHSFVAGLRRA